MLVDERLVQRLRLSSVEVRSYSQRRDHGGGSGIIWTTDGVIVTNAHVIRSRQPGVRLHDGREFGASILALDRERDLAVLRIHIGTDIQRHDHPLPAAEIGDSSRLRIGHIVTAVGNPLGLVGAVSAGIVHSTSDPRWIQADLHLAPGNSGGILADDQGRVIGINTMIYSGIAIAIPSNTASKFVRETLAREARGTRGESRAA